MDEIVKAALLKWPRVPHCYGWLALDSRGDWYLRDEQAQAAGPFPQVKGSRIEHTGLREFIQRNYEADERGCWYFQNGPQRVFVELEAAPWIFRVDAGAAADLNTSEGWRVSAQDGRHAVYRAAWLDERGRLFLDCDIGFGLVHSLDTGIALSALDSGDWRAGEMPFERMPAHFGYVLQPQPKGVDKRA
jgi:hypothetical protein